MVQPLLKLQRLTILFFKNQTILSQSVKIDTIPPQINLLKTVNYINQGGTGFVAYQPSKKIAYTGVYVNDYFTPGHTILQNNITTTVTYFAVPIDASKTKTRITIFARDDAGNETRMAIPLYDQGKEISLRQNEFK